MTTPYCKFIAELFTCSSGQRVHPEVQLGFCQIATNFSSDGKGHPWLENVISVIWEKLRDMGHLSSTWQGRWISNALRGEFVSGRQSLTAILNCFGSVLFRCLFGRLCPFLNSLCPCGNQKFWGKPHPDVLVVDLQTTVWYLLPAGAQPGKTTVYDKVRVQLFMAFDSCWNQVECALMVLLMDFLSGYLVDERKQQEQHSSISIRQVWAQMQR